MGKQRSASRNMCLLCALVIALLTLIVSAENAKASTMERTYAKKMTVSIGGTPKWWGYWTNLDMGSRLNGATKVTAKSSNNKILKASVRTPDEYINTYGVSFRQKKTGKATLTVNVWKGSQKSTYKIKVKVVKWKNPIASFKFGGKDYASKYNNYYATETTGSYGKQRIFVRLKKGWKVNKIIYHKYKVGRWGNKKIKNNSYVKFGRSDYLEVFAFNKKLNWVESYELRGQSAPIQDS